ncbi:Cytochrome P450 [Sesbania bispinosa]|nr:Cytochrome P450 [Sesbania bispinosa]
MVWLSDYPLLILLLLSFPLFLFLSSHRRKISATNRRRLPPGPAGWPVFGNMFQLGEMPHRTLTNLREKTTTMPSPTEPITETMRVHNYDKSSLALAPYGSYWRLMRRLVTVDMLVAKRINDTASVRRRCVNDMLEWVAKEARKLEKGRGLHVARFIFLMTFNLFGNLMLSRDLFDPDSEVGSEFFEAMMGLMEWTGHVNVTDLFPWLRWLDPQGLRRKMDRDMGKAIRIASRFVKERLEEQRENKSRDFLDVLLEFQKSESQEALNISDKDLNIFILQCYAFNHGHEGQAGHNHEKA